MLLSWIIKTIPRSPRAFLALLVMLGSVSLIFSALTELFVPSGVNVSEVLMKIVVGLGLGLPATAIFYYFQHLDEAKTHHKRELDILNNYMESEKRDRVYKQSTATSVFDSHSGEVKTGAPTTHKSRY